MTEVWKKIINDYINDYKSISQLKKDGIIDEEQQTELIYKLLFEIIETFKTEVNNEQES